MSVTLSSLPGHIDDLTVWGGDWNQALEGRDYVGSMVGREKILELVNDAGLSVPTGALGSASRGHRSVDHIAIPISWDVVGVQRRQAAVAGHRLSDHDAYVVSIDR